MIAQISRPIIVALLAALVLYLIADGLKLDAASNAITFAFFGVIVAIIVEVVIAIIAKRAGTGAKK